MNKVLSFTLFTLAVVSAQDTQNTQVTQDISLKLDQESPVLDQWLNPIACVAESSSMLPKVLKLLSAIDKGEEFDAITHAWVDVAVQLDTLNHACGISIIADRVNILNNPKCVFKLAIITATLAPAISRRSILDLLGALTGETLASLNGTLEVCKIRIF